MIKRILENAAGLLTVLLLAGSLTSPVQAQNLKVGYTDHEIIIVNMPAYQDVQQKLQQEFQGSQAELQQLYQDYQARLERYQKQQSLLSEQVRQEREQELMQLQQQIQEQAASKDQEIAQREVQLMQPLLERVQGAIDKVAQNQGLDLVLRAQVGNQPLLLYVNQDRIVDITVAVARELGLDVDATAGATN